jgi:hypothetical protein
MHMVIQRRRTSRAFGALLAIAALASAGCSFTGEHLERDPRTSRVDHVTASPIKVRTENGAVDVRSPGAPDAPSQVTIHAEVRARTVERLAQTHILATRDTDGTLFVRVEWPDGGRLGSEGCSFDIQLPDARGIDIASSNGSIRTENLKGNALLHTSNGNVTVQTQAGAVDVSTTNGGIHLTAITGDAVAESSNGTITIDGCRAQAKARTSNGSVKVRLDSEAAGPAILRTSNGSVTLGAGPSFRGVLRMSTSNGGVHFNTPSGVRTISTSKRDAVVAVGDRPDDAPESSIQTSNGTIQVEFH